MQLSLRPLPPPLAQLSGAAASAFFVLQGAGNSGDLSVTPTFSHPIRAPNDWDILNSVRMYSNKFSPRSSMRGATFKFYPIATVFCAKLKLFSQADATFIYSIQVDAGNAGKLSTNSRKSVTSRQTFSSSIQQSRIIPAMAARPSSSGWPP